jgi:Acetylglutamate semialdehyde dehydrogenase
MTYNIAILGASGYTGAELVRLIATHPHLRIAALSADRKAGQQMADVFPHLRHLDLPVLVKMEDIDFSGIDLVFAALPHGLSQALVRDLPESVKVVDLGADFRLRDPADYEKWYGAPHVAPALQKTAVYGLTEFYRDEIRSARLVAGTGCNAATVQFALRPLISGGLIDLDDIICDLKNGISGAGRSLKENMLFTERSSDVLGYSPKAASTGIWANLIRNFQPLPDARSKSSSPRIWCRSAAVFWPAAICAAMRRRSMRRCVRPMRTSRSSMFCRLANAPALAM